MTEHLTQRRHIVDVGDGDLRAPLPPRTGLLRVSRDDGDGFAVGQ
jgi:hypothetical protein